MRFGPVPLAKAQGAVLAHSLVLPGGGRLRKGKVLEACDLTRLAAAGVGEVCVARLEPGDVGEDAAAARLGRVLAGRGRAESGLVAGPARTGRVNLHAAGPGLLRVDAAAVERLNAVDAMITLATLPPWAQVAAGDLVATIKIISYAVTEAALARAEAAGVGALALARPVLRRVALVQTGAPGRPVDKGRRALAGRLAAFGAELVHHALVPHEVAPLARAIAAAPGEVICLLGQTATSDPRDVGPAALVQAGGRLVRFGLPVDPGNLLFLGDLSGRPVIGLPGCARSPALNGADWVLGRVLCGHPPGAGDMARMGVGGLLKEMPSRPAPREG